jgi:hypothetical protein
MLAPRRWLDRSAVVGLAVCMLACFTDAPPLDEDTGSTSAEDTTAAEGDATGPTTTTIGDDATSSPDTTAATDADATMTTAEAEAESETGTPACECPSNAALCDGFELDLSSWQPGAGLPPPMITYRDVHCGDGALRAEVAPEGSHSTISAEVIGTEPLMLPWSFGGWYYLAGGCVQPTPVRLLRLWFDDGMGTTPEYLVDVVVEPGALRLRATGPEFGSEVEGVLMQTETDAWIEFRIDFDFTSPRAPQVDATIGSGAVGIAAPPVVPEFGTLRVYPTLGPYLEGDPQDDTLCFVLYDDVWFGPSPQPSA